MSRYGVPVNKNSSGRRRGKFWAWLCVLGLASIGCKTATSDRGVQPGSKMSAGEVLRQFSLSGFTNDASGLLSGAMGSLDGKADERLLRAPFHSSRFDFESSVRSKWYQGVVVKFGDYPVYYSRGHWLNSATMVSTPERERRFPAKKVAAPEKFARIKANYQDGLLTFYYNNAIEDVVQIPEQHRSKPIRVGFCGYNAPFAFRDVMLARR